MKSHSKTGLAAFLFAATLLLGGCGGGSGGGEGGGDTTPTLNIADAQINEGDSGATTLSFSVSLDKAATDVINVDYTTADASATQGNDYTAASGTLSIPAGDTQASISVSINGDTDVEADETLSLTLSNLSANATAGDMNATGTILNDDSAPPVPAFTLLHQGLNDGVMTVLPAQDGSGDLYLGGFFSNYNQSGANAILRLNADGTRDSAFDNGSGFDHWVRTLAFAMDGSGDLYVGGEFTLYDGAPAEYLVRLNTDGSVDSGLSLGAGFNGPVYVVMPLDDGSGDLYVGGDFTRYDGTTHNHILRLNADGTVDGGFAAGSGFDEVVREIIPAGDGTGDIYVAGGFYDYDGTGANFLVRLNSDGSLDTGFDPGLGLEFYVNTIATVDDGTGDLYAAASIRGPTSTEYLVFRLNSDGSLNTPFAGFDDDVTTLMRSTDGSGDFYAGGLFSSYNGTPSNGIVRLNADGSIDNGFDPGTGFDRPTAFITSTGDGSGDLLVAGQFLSYDQQTSAYLVRLADSGQLSQAYSTTIAFNNAVLALAPADDGSGSLYAGGRFNRYDNATARHLARIDAQGRLDSNFVQGTGLNGDSFAIATSNDGSGDLYVGGNFTAYDGVTRNRILRLNSDGSLDPGFDPGSGFDLGVYSIRMAEDGSGDLYVGGDFTDYDGNAVGRIVRLNSDGSLDGVFAPVTGFDATVLQILTAGDGSGDIYVAGAFTSFDGATHNHLLRLDNKGSVDGDFVTGAGFNGAVYTIAKAVDGSDALYAGGFFSTYDGAIANTLVRLNGDGSVDTGFSAGNGFNLFLFALLPAGDGSGDLYVGGAFTDYNGSASNRLIRLTKDGSPDTAFVTQGGFNEAVYALAAANDGSGKIFAGGAFTTYATTTVNRIIALDPTGGIQ